MLSVTLFAATLACLVVPPLNVWAGPLLITLYFANAALFWTALGLSGLATVTYLLRRFRP